jgi:hypothetical protein
MRVSKLKGGEGACKRFVASLFDYFRLGASVTTPLAKITLSSLTFTPAAR